MSTHRYNPRPLALLFAVACVGVLLLTSATASASTVRIMARGEDPEMLTYQAGANEKNNVLVTELLLSGFNWVRVTDASPRINIRIGRGCRTSTPVGRAEAREVPLRSSVVRGGRTGATVYCRLPVLSGGAALNGPDGVVSTRVMRVNLGDLDDTLRSNLRAASALIGTGQTGVDVLRGGPETDMFCAASPVGPRCETDPSEAHVDRTHLNLPFEVLDGGGNADALLGSDFSDVIKGDAGDDFVSGHRGNDVVIGGPGNDDIEGGEGDDYLETSPMPPGNGVQARDWVRGSDHVNGGEGNDTYGFQYTEATVRASGTVAVREGLDGPEQDEHEGIEVIYLSRGNDTFAEPIAGINLRVYGEAGDDEISVSGNGSREIHDTVMCGVGDDSVWIDENDHSGRSSAPPVYPDGASSDECEHIHEVTR